MAGTRYEYILQLKDKMSGTLKKIGGEGTKLYDELQRKQEKLNSSMSGLGGIITKAGVALAAFGLGRSIVMAGADIEQTRIQYEVLMGSMEKGNKLFKEIQGYALKSNYNTMELKDNATTMLAFGIAQEKVIPSMEMLGDVAMGNKEKMKLLTLAYSQVQATGRLMGQDLLQMVNQGFNPLQIISEKTGISMASLKKKMESGAISAKMVEEAFRTATSEGGRYYNMQERLNKTVAGRWSNMIEKLQIKITAMGEAINPAIGWIIDKFSALIDNGSKAVSFFSGLYDKVRNGNPLLIALGAIVASITVVFAAWQLVTWGIVAATTAWKWASNALNTSLFANPVFWIIAGVVALIAAIGYVIYKTDGWGKTWKNLMSYMKLTLQQMGAWFELKGLQISDAFLSAFGLIEKGWYKIQSLWDKDAANKGLATLEAKRNARAEEIAQAKGRVAELSRQRKEMTVWEMKWNKGRTIKDGVADLKSKLGLNTETTGAGGMSTDGSLNDMVNATGKDVAAGGSRPTNITINLRNMVETLTIQSANLKEGTNEMERMVREAMMRILNSANGVVANG